MAYSIYLSLDVIGTGRLKIEEDGVFKNGRNTGGPVFFYRKKPEDVGWRCGDVSGRIFFVCKSGANNTLLVQKGLFC